MSEVSRLEQQLADQKYLRDRRTRVLRLSKNADFRKVILEEFCTEECARYAQESADPCLTQVQRADAMAIAQAAGHLKRYLQITLQLTNNVDDDIERLEQAINEARLEADQVEGAE